MLDRTHHHPDREQSSRSESSALTGIAVGLAGTALIGVIAPNLSASVPGNGAAGNATVAVHLATHASLTSHRGRRCIGTCRRAARGINRRLASTPAPAGERLQPVPMDPQAAAGIKSRTAFTSMVEELRAAVAVVAERSAPPPVSRR